MSVFDVCATVNVNAGGSFQWSNLTRIAGVKVTPVTTWPLPQSEYDIQAGATTGPFGIPSTTPPNTTYGVQVQWMLSTTPGLPCPLLGGNPKIVVGNTVPSFGKKPKKAKPAKKKSKPAAKKKTVKPAKKKTKAPAKKKASAKKKKKH